MKKFVAMLLTIALLISGTAISAFAYSTGFDDGEINAGELFGELSVAFEEATVIAGESVTVDLVAKNNSGFTKLVIELTVDEGLILDGVIAPNGISAVLEGNVLTVTVAETFDADEAFAALNFTAAEDAEGKKTVAMALTAKNGNEDVKVAASNGFITVEAPVVVAIVGDVNGDGSRDAADLAVLKKVIAKLTAIDDPDVVNPDVDGSGGFPNAADLAKLKKLIAKLED